MSNFNLLRRLPRLALATLCAAVAACTVETDDTLGSNLVPENQQMKAGYLALAGTDLRDDLLGGLHPRKYVETRLYQTDSIVSSNISNGYFGSMRHKKLGRRTAGFLTQHVNYYKVDSGYFGYRPIFDSAQLQLSIASYGGDTTRVQRFGIFEVTSNDYLEQNGDSTFYLRFDPVESGALQADAEPLFTFTLGGDRGPATTAVTLTPTAAGRDYVSRLFLQSGKYAGDYSIYSRDSISQWLEEFKGLYIRPLENPEGDGTIYVTSLESSGLALYGRNRRPEDPTLIRDTVGMLLNFIDPYSDNANLSINSFRHDYAEGELGLKIEEIGEQAPERPERTELIVEGMGGALTELTFTQEFFDALDKVLADELAASKKSFSTLAFSQAMIYFYFPSSIYDYLSLTPSGLGEAQYGSLLEEMDGAQERLGLYTSYKKLSAIPDYAYAYEQQYSTKLSYGGYVNRSHGCYAMNITGYVQQMWNSYRNERDAAAAEGRAIDLEKVDGRTIYLGPEAYSAYSFDVSFLQGAPGGEGTQPAAPIRFEFTYNMVK